MGLYPSEVTITSEGKVLFVRFKDAVSPSEVNLSSHKAGKKLLREVTDKLCQDQFPTLKDIIYELTERELLEVQVEINIALREKIYILTLDRSYLVKEDTKT